MSNKGFTLVEILIVVIILGILAAIVIPQFTEASNDARESALQSDLQTARSQLELFKVQHMEKYPNEITAVGSDSAKFVAQLTSRTDANGNVGTDAATYPYGPYLQKFPSNSFVSGTGTDTDAIKFGATAVTGDGTTGWYFDTAAARFSANSDKTKYPLHITW